MGSGLHETRFCKHGDASLRLRCGLVRSICLTFRYPPVQNVVPIHVTLSPAQECFHVVIAERTSMFVGCQVCKFLQGMISSTARQFAEVLDALKLRLGKHYAFQASQRLADERLMEQARRSDNAEW